MNFENWAYLQHKVQVSFLGLFKNPQKVLLFGIPYSGKFRGGRSLANQHFSSSYLAKESLAN